MSIEFEVICVCGQDLGSSLTHDGQIEIDACTQCADEAFGNGELKGRDDGWDEGKSAGYDEGFAKGEEEGFDNGYKQGQKESE